MTAMTITKPVIELKSIKRAGFASQETHCFEATLYVDGVKWGQIVNEGHGGPDNFYGVPGKGWDDIKVLNERIGKTYPQFGQEWGHAMDMTLEVVCGELVNEWLRDKDFVRIMKKLPHIQPGKEGVFNFKLPKGLTPDAALPKLRAKYPAYKFLADMPVEEAKKLLFA